MTGEVIDQQMIAGDIYSLWVRTSAADSALAGQFVSLFCRDRSMLLPRPISICEIDRSKGALRFVYRVVGKGTEYLCTLKANDKVDLIGPLGNGFDTKGPWKNALLIGGGLGVPPMLQLAKELSDKAQVVVGYRDITFLRSEFESSGSRVYIATEDGSTGTKGNVLDAIKENDLKADVIFACGPKPMLAAIKAYAGERNIKCFVSMEERMACGIGACLGCVCKTSGKDAHSNVENARVCADGPVFDAQKVEL